MSMDALQERLQYNFQDPQLLVVALTHRSWTEEGGNGEHNERLEFLGDAVLELAVTELLFRRFPGASEGAMSRLRSMLVRKDSLAEVGRRWELGPLIRLGRGERMTKGGQKERLLANAVEAVLGALYTDAGALGPCRVAVELAFHERIDRIEDPNNHGVNPKSRLQELTMARWKLIPRYTLLSEEGPPHQRVFSVQVKVGEHLEAEGSGRSKRRAQVAAAQRALSCLEEEEE